MRIEQYFLMTDYAIWEVIVNGDSPPPKRIVDGFVANNYPIHYEEKFARKDVDLMEAIKKGFGEEKVTVGKQTKTKLLEVKMDLDMTGSDHAKKTYNLHYSKFIFCLQDFHVTYSKDHGIAKVVVLFWGGVLSGVERVCLVAEKKRERDGIENLIDLKVKVIRCDNGTEFKNRVMNQFYEMKGIKRVFSVARTSQQNGVVERKNRTLIEAVRTMLVDSKLLTTFWGETVNTACYVQNKDTLPIAKHSGNGYSKRKPKMTKAEHGMEKTKSNQSQIVAGNQSNGNAGTKACDDAGKARMETVPSKDYILLPLWTQDSSFFSSLKDSPYAAFKPCREEEKKDVKHPENEDNEVPTTEEPGVNQEKDENINSTNNINTVSSTVNAADIEDNVDDENIVYGCAHDPNMPNLEENVYSNDDDVGAEADMTNLDTHIPVWTLVDLPYGKRVIGTKWVYGKKKDERGIVVRNKARLVTQGYTQEEGIDYDEFYGKIEEKSYIFNTLGLRMCTNFEKMMHKKFQMSSMGELTFFLGLQVTQKHNEIFISQDNMYTYGDFKAFDEGSKAEDVDVHLYRSMISSLMYLTSSRPDIMFVYPKDSPFDLEAYTNSDYAGASLDRKSTTRGCQFLRRRLISWQCKKQTIVANSTTEAEYVAASNCCGQISISRFKYGMLKTAEVLIEGKLIELICSKETSRYAMNGMEKLLRMKVKLVLACILSRLNVKMPSARRGVMKTNMVHAGVESDHLIIC
ncbi:putative reverse transcriptase domain-containing protein [Tanacetum coccineum]|uniref:Reverse transcriptase domain-containing protein n=1 Tax=Tanacetum coccineum TaxID=301880 RepID=A0ABQ5GX50_9ASTR